MGAGLRTLVLGGVGGAGGVALAKYILPDITYIEKVRIKSIYAIFYEKGCAFNKNQSMFVSVFFQVISN